MRFNFNLISFLILASGGIYIVYLVLLGKVQIRDYTLDPSIYLYREIIGDSKAINQELGALGQNLKGSNINQYTLAALVPALSGNRLHQNQKFIAGVLLSKDLDKHAKEFAKSHPEYKISHLPSIKTITTTSSFLPTFPYSFFFNYVVYDKLLEYGERNRIFFKNNTKVLIQIFSEQEEQSGNYKVKTLIPFGDNVKSLMLTKFDKPIAPEITEL